jgi:hypothetical protein
MAFLAGQSCRHSTKDVPGDPDDGPRRMWLERDPRSEGGSQPPSVDETGIRRSGDALLDDVGPPAALIEPGLLHVQPAVAFSRLRKATVLVIAESPAPPRPASHSAELVASR